MSISATASHSAVWNNAASALTNSPQASALTGAKPNDASNTKGKSSSNSIAVSNPFDALSQSSQFALIQAQAQRS